MLKRSNPFAFNPFGTGIEVKLVPIPDAPETHEVRKPARSYLAPAGGGMSLDGLLGGAGRGGRRPVEVVRTLYRDPPQSDEDGDEAPRPRFGG